MATKKRILGHARSLFRIQLLLIYFVVCLFVSYVHLCYTRTMRPSIQAVHGQYRRDTMHPPCLPFIDQRHHAQYQASDRAVMLESSTSHQLGDFHSTIQEVCNQRLVTNFLLLSNAPFNNKSRLKLSWIIPIPESENVVSFMAVHSAYQLLRVVQLLELMFKRELFFQKIP